MTTTAIPPASSRGMPAWMIVLALFMVVVGIANGIFVWLSNGRHDLVRDDYYAAGLKQDSVIALNSGNTPVNFHREGADWKLENAAGPAPATGCRLRLYRPDDVSADREVRLQRVPAEAGREAWKVAAPALRRGRWIATVVWDRDGVDVREVSLNLTEG
ncbi:MAG: FixH family protein [Fibrobacteres bacterium]|nr:FixH family protein [Fibrobacterota bacterium]